MPGAFAARPEAEGASIHVLQGLNSIAAASAAAANTVLTRSAYLRIRRPPLALDSLVFAFKPPLRLSRKIRNLHAHVLKALACKIVSPKRGVGGQIAGRTARVHEKNFHRRALSYTAY
jgi:hypothetical protein